MSRGTSAAVGGLLDCRPVAAIFSTIPIFPAAPFHAARPLSERRDQPRFFAGSGQFHRIAANFLSPGSGLIRRDGKPQNLARGPSIKTIHRAKAQRKA